MLALLDPFQHFSIGEGAAFGKMWNFSSRWEAGPQRATKSPHSDAIRCFKQPDRKVQLKNLVCTAGYGLSKRLGQRIERQEVFG
jgi:hypothetical protein